MPTPPHHPNLPLSAIRIEVYREPQKPEDFHSTLSATACYLEIDNRLLFIQQGKGRLHEGLWGAPGGKIESGETPEAAAMRELFEETGIELTSSNQMNLLETLYVRKPDIDYVFYLFEVRLETKPLVQLSIEHSGYLWAKREELMSLPLRPGVREALAYYRG